MLELYWVPGTQFNSGVKAQAVPKTNSWIRY
jgi:hypothetical protein